LPEEDWMNVDRLAEALKGLLAEHRNAGAELTEADEDFDRLGQVMGSPPERVRYRLEIARSRVERLTRDIRAIVDEIEKVCAGETLDEGTAAEINPLLLKARNILK
jgi:hypothetical protein